MNPNYAYQLYRAERIKTRAEILADDARLGRGPAALSRSGRRAGRTACAWVLEALNAVREMAARAARRPDRQRRSPGPGVSLPR
jgi:hypothetical protein